MRVAVVDAYALARHAGDDERDARASLAPLPEYIPQRDKGRQKGATVSPLGNQMGSIICGAIS